MVLAVAEHLDVAHQNELVVPLHFLESPGKVRGRILRVPSEVFTVGSHDARRCVAKALALGVLSEIFQEPANVLLGKGGT
jgi:hypothetical protein